MKKKFILAIAVACLVIALIGVTALASSITTSIQVTYRNIGVSVNGKTVTTEQEPFIFEGRTYLAARDIAGALGMEIRFNEITDTLEITAPQTAQNTTPQNAQNATVHTSPQQKPPVPAEAAQDRKQRPANPSITRERAQEIAVEWLNANGITGARRDGGVSMDFERGRWVWEIEYELGRQEWEFYICVMTGEIIYVDIDWD